jgi:glutathionyl-hydroquinone reductase
MRNYNNKSLKHEKEKAMSGMLIAGKWEDEWKEHNPDGQYNPKPTQFRNFVTADGSSGYPAAAGRYHLYVALGCPWAQRTLIMRELKGLQDVISVAIVDPIMSDHGWIFSDAPGAIPDTVNQAQYLYEIYLKADPNYTGRVTVPVLWDRQQHTIVNNESREIMRMLDVEFVEFATQNVDFYPRELQYQIDATIDAIVAKISVGVYQAGFTTSQTVYEAAVTAVFEALDQWEAVLGKQPYLCGNQLTEADIGFFTTLYRFDAVYYSHFKCNFRRIIDYPNLWHYLKALYQWPEFKVTCNLDQIKRGYYMSMPEINPSRIVPIGPILDFE